VPPYGKYKAGQRSNFSGIPGIDKRADSRTSGDQGFPGQIFLSFSVLSIFYTLPLCET
jgi:hypothetical protein